VKVIHHTNKFLLHLTKREKHLLFELLGRYPQIPRAIFS